MRIIAFDVGERRIGMAISDSLMLASGIGSYTRRDDSKDFEEIVNVIKEYRADKIIVGLPRNMNGTYGPQAEKCRSFGEKLHDLTGIEVIYEDERLTTAAAQRTLIAAGVSRGKRKQIVDELAARMILQSYLDRTAKQER
ncbi:MAG TPA: Holliday junction resolvase RuvX [Clostridia bacterium]|nr:Holliday junction resolvase RuvX [Clostridia bacterium]